MFQKSTESIGFIDRATEIVQKACVLYFIIYNKTSPGPPGHQAGATDSGSGWPILAWIYYEEPLQPTLFREHTVQNSAALVLQDSA